MANSVAEVSSSTPTKRRKLSQNDNNRGHPQQQQQQQQPLLPGLPDHVAQGCLSLLHPSTLFSVCHAWRRVIYTRSFPPFLSLYALLSSSPGSSVHFYNFDPISRNWRALPSTPTDPPLRLSLRHPSFISRSLPVQSVSASGKLILLAATTHDLYPALPRPLIFDPGSARWDFGPPLATPRRWCATGSVGGAVYVASGIGSHFSDLVARSVEKWDPTSNSKWEKVSSLKDGRYSRDAIAAVGWRGKLCMVNLKGNGVIYDSLEDTWREMPEGMIGGWNGPVAAMDEDVMYVVDESKGALRRYDPERDTWDLIMESEGLRGADQIAAGGERVCVVCRGRIAVVDVTAPRPRVWEVETPSGMEAVAIHVLPRMSQPV